MIEEQDTAERQRIKALQSNFASGAPNITVYHYPNHAPDREDDSPDYYPLTVAEVCQLLEAARYARKCAGSNPYADAEESSVQNRLVQGIPGMTYVRPDEGEVYARLVELEQVFVNWTSQPYSVLESQEIAPSHEVVVRLCEILGIQE